MFMYFPDNYAWSFQVLRGIAESHFGGGDFNEIHMLCSKIKHNDNDSWFNEWMKMGQTVMDMGDKACSEGHMVSAKEAFFRAANYFRLSEFFLSPFDDRRKTSYSKCVECFHAAVKLSSNIEIVEIPYEKSSLSGYFLCADKNMRKPTVLFFGGLDSTAEELYFTAGTAFLDRGWNCLIVDGPGQGKSLRVKGIHTVYNYEKPVGSVVDYMLTRKEVDPEKIVLMAMSMGGYYAPRAAAFEHRLAACIVWGANYDLGKLWASRPDNHPLVHHIQWVLGVNSIKEARELLKNFSLEGIGEKIKCPTFVLHGADDVQVSYKDAERLYNDMTCPKKLKIFSTEEGGSAHCQYDNLHLAHYEITNWLEDVFNLKFA